MGNRNDCRHDNHFVRHLDIHLSGVLICFALNHHCTITAGDESPDYIKYSYTDDDGTRHEDEAVKFTQSAGDDTAASLGQELRSCDVMVDGEMNTISST